MMAPSSTFKNKRDKNSPILLKNLISRDKSESINELSLSVKKPTRKWHIWFFPRHEPTQKKQKSHFFQRKTEQSK